MLFIAKMDQICPTNTEEHYLGDTLLILEVNAYDFLKEFFDLTNLTDGQFFLTDSSNRIFLDFNNYDVNLGIMTEEPPNQYIKSFNNSGYLLHKNLNLNRGINRYLSEEYKLNNISVEGGVWQQNALIKRDVGNLLFTDNKAQFFANVLRSNKIYLFSILCASLIIALLTFYSDRANAKVLYYARYDGLTGVLNRRAGLEKAKEVFFNGDRRDGDIVFCYIDINDLKKVNDTLGHSYGDDLIQVVSDAIIHEIRPNDFVIRLGGDEFLIVLTNIPIEKGEVVWERILKRISHLNSVKDLPFIISVSHGIIGYTNKERLSIPSDKKISELIAKADMKMYEEKRAIKKSEDGTLIK